jgi:predicted MPP superfamily phosphohydrolase
MKNNTMQQAIFWMVIAFGIFLIIDIYTFQAIKLAFGNHTWINVVYWLITLFVLGYMIYSTQSYDRASAPQKIINNFMGMMVLSYVPKLLIIILLFSEDLFRLVQGSIVFLVDFFSQGNSGQEEASYIPGRRKFISQIGLALAAIPLGSILYGIYKGKYNFRVIRQTVFFEDLPDAFDGFTIAQISDIHSGSFTNKEKITYGVDLVNEQNADMIVFTGDLVNNKADEMEPWMDVFGKLNAPYGMYSILGNHDYGDYVTWPSDQAKADNLDRLKEVHKELGFKLMLDESTKIEKGSSSIDLLGIQNWGAGGFAKYGDFEKALSQADKESFKVLLSHDPSHYDSQVKNHDTKIDLTLSGHTHGMQFGIEIPGWLKFSPVQFRYPKWAGLYEENKRHLYVNRGFGYLAFPGRVGIWPEITMIELKKKQA